MPVQKLQHIIQVLQQLQIIILVEDKDIHRQPALLHKYGKRPLNVTSQVELRVLGIRR